MATRFLLLLLAGACLTMNVLVWRTEYGARDNDFPVPEILVWHKIMTAPEASSLNVFQNGKRTGFCEFSTGVGQEMAQLDESKPPPEGFINHAGYQIRINGNASLGDFTNRIKFDGFLEFTPNRIWRSLEMHILMRGISIELESFATNQTVRISFTSEGETIRRVLTFADLQDPNRLMRSFTDGFGGSLGGLMADLEFPAMSAAEPLSTGGIQWEATRTRIMFGHEPVPVYRLETRVLDHPIVIVVSTLGEVLRVELPGNVIATLDEWSKD
jgi:hypothetical protein